MIPSGPNSECGGDKKNTSECGHVCMYVHMCVFTHPYVWMLKLTSSCHPVRFMLVAQAGRGHFVP